MTALLQSGTCCRAYPDRPASEALPRWIGCQRFIINSKVEEDRLFAAQRRLLLRAGVPAADIATPLDQQYAQFKDAKLTPWLLEVPSPVLRNGAFRWMSAKQRQLAGLAGAPRKRHRGNCDSVLLTAELFRFVPDPAPAKGFAAHVIEIGTAAHPVGLMRFRPSGPYEVPRTLVVRRRAGRWMVSFCFEHAHTEALRTPAELAYELNGLPDEDLRPLVVGLDRNVADNSVAASDGRFFAITPAQRERIARKRRGALRHQRQLARRKKGSCNRAKAGQRIARKREYEARVAQDFAHQTSYTLVSGTTRCFVVEALHIQGMTRRPKARRDPATGAWQRNGRRQKAGLNRAILGAAWGRTRHYLSYKAARRNQLVVSVPAAYSSQECSRCGHTHPGNREQSRFACQRCGFAAHADTNASLVQRQRGLALLRSRSLEQARKPPKRTALRRKDTTGAGSSGVPVEPGVSRDAAKYAAPRGGLRSRNSLAVRPETPTTTEAFG